MSQTSYLSSSRVLAKDLVEGAKALSPFVLELPQNQPIELNGVDCNRLEDVRPPVKLFLADMDSTMIGQECIDELADFAGVKAEVAHVTERAMQGELDFEEALRARVALLKGLPETVLEECYETRIVPNPGAPELLEALGQAGVHRVLVSGGFTYFASRIAERLGFDEYHANILGIRDGKLTGEVEGEIVSAATKAEILMSQTARLNLAASETAAIGDGANDLLMIEMAGVGIAYRAKPKLKENADLILDYTHLSALVEILDLRRRS